MRELRAELVRIDSRGQAHAIGAVASQRLRARQGTYRVLPAPQHLILMRASNEEGERQGDAVARLAGEIPAPGSLCDIVAFVAQTGWRGELAVFAGDECRSVFFDRGNIVGAVTNVEAERIGSILYKFGAIDAAQRDRTLAAAHSGKRFGEAAIDLGFLTQEQLYRLIAKQVEEIVCAALALGDGTFFFLDGFDDSRLVVRHTASATALLMDAVTRMDELQFFRQKIPTMEHVPTREEGPSPPHELTALYALVDGQRTIAELGRLTGLGDFETSKQLYALVQSHHVSIQLPRDTGGPVAIVAAANDALTVIFEAAVDGGRDAEVRESLASFASGAGVYDMLFRRAGPSPLGTFETKTVVDNSLLVAGGAEAAQVLKQMLHEYVSFALFSAGAALGSAAESGLVHQVGPMLAVLRPQG